MFGLRSKSLISNTSGSPWQLCFLRHLSSTFFRWLYSLGFFLQRSLGERPSDFSPEVFADWTTNDCGDYFRRGSKGFGVALGVFNVSAGAKTEGLTTLR